MVCGVSTVPARDGCQAGDEKVWARSVAASGPGGFGILRFLLSQLRVPGALTAIDVVYPAVKDKGHGLMVRRKAAPLRAHYPFLAGVIPLGLIAARAFGNRP
jgi:hypothetical protein